MSLIDAMLEDEPHDPSNQRKSTNSGFWLLVCWCDCGDRKFEDVSRIFADWESDTWVYEFDFSALLLALVLFVHEDFFETSS
jgi:hypothetical protein